MCVLLVMNIVSIIEIEVFYYEVSLKIVIFFLLFGLRSYLILKKMYCFLLFVKEYLNQQSLYYYLQKFKIWINFYLLFYKKLFIYFQFKYIYQSNKYVYE